MGIRATTLADIVIKYLRFGARCLVRAFTLASGFIEPLSLGASWSVRTLTVARTRIESLVSRTCDYLWTSAGTDRCVKYLGRIWTALNKVWTLALACVLIKPLPWWTFHNSRASALAGIAVKGLSRVWACLGNVRTFTLTGPVIEYLNGIGTSFRSVGTLTFAEYIVENLWLIACQHCWALTLTKSVIEDLVSRTADMVPRTLTLASPVIKFLSWVGTFLGPVRTFTLT